jgi:hypothetical protein
MRIAQNGGNVRKVVEFQGSEELTAREQGSPEPGLH